MSKESYIRGFCKVAEAHGVDAVQLAKYAQQYKTEGWAPEFLGHKNGIPYTTKGGDKEALVGGPTPYDVSWATKDYPSDPSVLGYDQDIGKRERLARILDPRRAAYNIASTNAAQKAWSLLARAGYNMTDEVKLPEHLARGLRKIWDDEMKRTTSAPPAQVSAPAKK